MTDLDKLIEAVEVGKDVEAAGFIADLRVDIGVEFRYAIDAYFGSLDAARALHEALLPGWIVQELSQNSRSMGWNILLVSTGGTYISSHYRDVGFINCPARAWLLAALKAYRAQQEAKQ